MRLKSDRNMALTTPPKASAGRDERSQSVVLRGTGVSSGIVIARALVFQREEVPIFRIPVARLEVRAECKRVEAALRLTRRQLREMKSRTGEALGKEHAYIFDAQLLMLDDPLLVERILEVIRTERVNAEWAVKVTLDELVEIFDGIQDDYLRERKGDIFDVAGRLLRNMAGGQHHAIVKLERDYVLVSDNVRPSDTAQFDWKHIAGLTMEGGSRTYHTAILSRSLGIPCVVGVPHLMEHVDHGATLVLDGRAGVVVVNPDRRTLREYRAKSKQHRTWERKLVSLRELPAETTDGYRITLQANLDFPEESKSALQSGAEGVGLFRSEYFLARHGEDFPTEEEQYRVYRDLAEKMRPSPVIVRTFDLAGGQIDGRADSEPNPALGLRGARLLMRHKDLFKIQLRALLRARCHGNVKVMFPMVSGVEELRQARALLEEAKEELRATGQAFEPDLPCGLTLEVPSATATADLLAREADFFSIGSNDLMQYLLAVDRGNEQVSYLYAPLHPALLRTLRFTIDAGHQTGIRVAMCGEMASDPLLVVLLVGLELDELSMNPLSIPWVKSVIRNLSAAEAREIARVALELSTADEIAAFVAERIADRIPEGARLASSTGQLVQGPRDRAPRVP